jgi:BASS family bile acid:Na+ symporter
MDDSRHPLASLSHFIHRRFIWWVVGSYVLAAVFPAPGLWLRGISFGALAVAGEHTEVTLPVLMLAFMLFNAGLGLRAGRLKGLVRRPQVLLAGLAANLVVPVAFILAVTYAMRVWHNPEEVQQILVGLALVASMPIAGSSTAWSQNANGDLALALGLVLFSTLLSPLTTPLALHAGGLLASGDYAAALRGLADSGAGGFLAVGVVLPSVLGILGHVALGEDRVARAQPYLKLANSLNLLLLNYSNAAVSLPQAVAEHDWDFLAVLLGIVAGLCCLAFAAGWGVARLTRADPAQRTALMFGLGMNNNGTGLVLAGMALAGYPRVLLPIIFYNLVQHLVAAVVDGAISRRQDASRGTEDYAAAEGAQNAVVKRAS